jgi:hypothetical protein
MKPMIDHKNVFFIIDILEHYAWKTDQSKQLVLVSNDVCDPPTAPDAFTPTPGPTVSVPVVGPPGAWEMSMPTIQADALRSIASPCNCLIFFAVDAENCAPP